uniref:Uncharacterized protein n=1 Tax=Siphoviridae sp. cttJO12 TaxID=2826492 RepID=A0A8S5R0M2_9CAUD|nr:MAG TPA: hypothetical protein [Siphoviridae sp. cttJO12]DAN00344.1 MAG TPA: hypothetical protein [Caudoviricetes sp.]
MLFWKCFVQIYVENVIQRNLSESLKRPLLLSVLTLQ